MSRARLLLGRTRSNVTEMPEVGGTCLKAVVPLPHSGTSKTWRLLPQGGVAENTSVIQLGQHLCLRWLPSCIFCSLSPQHLCFPCCLPQQPAGTTLNPFLPLALGLGFQLCHASSHQQDIGELWLRDVLCRTCLFQSPKHGLSRKP